MLIFGITGYKASGKSTVGSIINNRYNIPVIDIDSMYSAILNPGTFAYKEIITCFGQEAIDDKGDVDIKKLSIMACKEQWIMDVVNEIIEKEV